MTTANIFWHAICVHISCTSFLNRKHLKHCSDVGQSKTMSNTFYWLDTIIFTEIMTSCLCGCLCSCGVQSRSQKSRVVQNIIGVNSQLKTIFAAGMGATCTDCGGSRLAPPSMSQLSTCNIRTHSLGQGWSAGTNPWHRLASVLAWLVALMGISQKRGLIPSRGVNIARIANAVPVTLYSMVTM